jgi:hypothetical protein
VQIEQIDKTPPAEAPRYILRISRKKRNLQREFSAQRIQKIADKGRYRPLFTTILVYHQETRDTHL